MHKLFRKYQITKLGPYRLDQSDSEARTIIEILLSLDRYSKYFFRYLLTLKPNIPKILIVDMKLKRLDGKEITVMNIIYLVWFYRNYFWCGTSCCTLDVKDRLIKLYSR